jgi:hypothetical protein
MHDKRLRPHFQRGLVVPRGHGDGGKQPPLNPIDPTALPIPLPFTTPGGPGDPPATDSLTSDTATDTTSDTTSSSTTSSITTSSSMSTISSFVPPTPTFVPVTTPVPVQVSTSYLTTHVSSATPSASAAPASGVSASTIAGGIFGTLAGLACLVILAMFIVRRARRRRDEQDALFSAESFRRSAILIEETTPDHRPRPPTMIERKLANFPPVPSQQFGGNQLNVNSPGSPNPLSQSPVVPVFSTAPYGPSPITPYGSNYNPLIFQQQQQQEAATSNGRYVNRMSPRQNLTGMNPSNGDPRMDPHYVDLNRASVSPYQAAQYAEIERKLKGDHLVEEVPVPPLPYHSQGAVPTIPEEQSPFADPGEETEAAPRPVSKAPMLPEIKGGEDGRMSVGMFVKRETVYDPADAYGGI